MRREDIGTALAIQHLHCNSLESMEQRILLQKKFYLAQSLGAEFNYHFNWYLRGPYSKDLTAVAFDVIPQGTAELTGYRLTEETTETLDKVNALTNLGPVSLSESSWFELLASMVYLRDEYRQSGLQNKEDVKEKLSEFKPWYSNENIERAWKVCAEKINA